MDRGRPRLVLAAALTFSLFSSLLFSSPFTGGVKDRVYDFLLRARAEFVADRPVAGHPVTIVAIDDATLNFAPLSVPELFPHHYYTTVIKALHRAGARGVALTRMLPRRGYAFSDPMEVREWFDAVREVTPEMPVISGIIWRQNQMVLPATDYLLSMEAESFGFLNLKRDEDAQVRRLPIRWPNCQGSLGCRSLAWLGAKALEPELEEPGDEIYIDFDPRQDSVPVQSFLDVYRRGAALTGGEATAEAAYFERFRDKLVLIGEINFLNQDSYPTPFSEVNGRGGTQVEIAAQAILTLLDNKRFRVFGPMGELVFLLALSMVALTPLMLSQRCGPYPGLWLPSALVPPYLLAMLSAFLSNLYLPVLPGLAVLVLTQIFGLTVRSSEGREATRTSLTALSLYVNPTLAEQIVAHPEFLARSGQRREMTVFFSDLVGFTTLAEHLSPEDLVVSLNRYFETMEPIISSSRGILDKFGGDSIMAFWGAPLVPRADHAAAACQAAVDQQAALARLNTRLRGEGHPPFSALMGLTTGPMVVGNIGAESRLNYTVMGDAVNLASRLVAVNKIYQTNIIVSENAAIGAGTAVEMRPLDRITVPGRRESLMIFEVMGHKGDLSDNYLLGRDRFEAALRLYFKRDFNRALGLFEETLSFIQGDGPSELMSARCREFLRVPPPDDWQGVTTLAVK